MAPVNLASARSVDQHILHFGMTGIVGISYHTLSIPTMLNFKIQYNTIQCIHTFTVFLLPVTVRTYQTVLFKELHILHTHHCVWKSVRHIMLKHFITIFLSCWNITLFHSLHLLFGSSKPVFLPLPAVLPEKSKDTILQIMSQRLA